MATYLLFEFADYYPGGGLGDLHTSFEASSDADAIERAVSILLATKGFFENLQLAAVDAGEAREVDVDLDRLMRERAA